MPAERATGIYLVTDTGAEVELILIGADGKTERLPAVSPADDLVAFVNRDFSAYKKKLDTLWKTHPLFEAHENVLISEYEDFLAQALPLTDQLRELDPVAHFDATTHLSEALKMEDDGDSIFLSKKGSAIGKALNIPCFVQNRLRNLFEVVFAYSERDTQQERFQSLEQVWPGILDRDYPVRFLPRPGSGAPIGTMREYHPDGLFELFLIELSLYFQQSKKRIARCENCWRYFVPKTAAKTLYCDGAMDGVPCKEAGPKYKRRFEADRDTALEIYNRLRRNLMERADRYETAPEWQRDKLKPFDRQQYDAWLPMAQEMKKRYETGKITAEEFLDAIDIFQEEQHDAKRQTLPDARRTPLYRRIIENIDFDPAREYCDRAVLHLDLEDDHPEWKIQTSEQLQLRARGGYESLHARYGVEDPVEPLRDTDFPKTIGDMEDSEIEKLLILRQAVQDYLKSWNEY